VSYGETKLKGVEFVKDWAIQIITLASAIPVLSATFYKNIFLGAPEYRWLLDLSWVLFFIAIGPGIFVLGALSHELNDAPGVESLNIYKANVIWTACAEAVTFLLAVALFLAFILLNMPTTAIKAPDTTATISGPITANRPIRATGSILAAGSVTATGSITATGPVTVKSIVNPHRAYNVPRQGGGSSH
jgi:hypothetical protein